MAYEAAGAEYAITLAPIYPTLGNSRPKGSSSVAGDALILIRAVTHLP